MRTPAAALLAIVFITGCCSTPEPKPDPELSYTAPYYHPEQSLRYGPHGPDHANHQAPRYKERRPEAPAEGDVVFSRQNRYPVRADFQRTGSRDLGAAYQIEGDQYVLSRVYPHQVVNGWKSNPQGVPEHYRDPECFYAPVGLQAGYIDRCMELRKADDRASADIRGKGGSGFGPAPDSQRAGAPPPPSGKEFSKALKTALGNDDGDKPVKYCWDSMTPEKDGCVYPK